MSPITATPATKESDKGQESDDRDVQRRRLPVGAEVRPGGGVHFRVWAPNCAKLQVVFEAKDRGTVPGCADLTPEGNGYYSGTVAAASAGDLYRFRTESGNSYPDPASRFQPRGPHGPSQVIDPGSYAWRDEHWKGLRPEGQVLYELHLGTFTRKGTWQAAAERLPRLAELGITVVEIMPVAEFSGDFGWGYDGVDLFAPYHVYGEPDDMRRFVDQAHKLRLGVILDVVYNHFGPDGCYHHEFSAHYVQRERTGNDWGDALNFDGPQSGPVREYFIANSGYWISEYHLDGLRLDATHAIHDSSPEHILAQINRHAREAAGDRSVLLIAENESQNARLVRPTGQGGYGLDGVWNDDFHHSARVALTGRSEAYYCDYSGTPQELISAVRSGYLFQGQFCKWQQKMRGTSTAGVPARCFVTYLENHDQVANSARGLRLKDLTSPGRYRAMIGLWLLAPATPLLFQGQELGTSRPFLYFTDFTDPLANLVREGRRRELSGFRSTTHPDLKDSVADPISRAALVQSTLEDAAECSENPMFLLFQDLLRLRREDSVFRLQRGESIQGAVIGPEALALRFLGDDFDDRLLLVNLGRDLYPLPNSEPLLAPPPARQWSVLWYSEQPRYGGSGVVPLEANRLWRLTGHCAAVLSAKAGQPRPEEAEMGSAEPEDDDIHPAVRRMRRQSRTQAAT